MAVFRYPTLLLLFAAALTVGAEVSRFQIDRSRIWLSAQDEPLPHLLERFAEAGVQVQADPALQKTVSGSWEDAEVEEVLEQLLRPYDYLLDWQRVEGPLGPRINLTGIRVYREGHAAALQNLRPRREVQVALDGKTRFLAREILVGFGPGASIEDLRAFLARTGGSVIAANTELGIYRILLPDGANVLDLVEQFKNDPQIALAEPNYVYDLPGLLPGGSSSSDLVKQWTPPSGDKTMAVAVLDSGLIPSESLNSAVVSAFDATNPEAPLAADAVGHGTLMAQLAAGLLDPYGRSAGEGVPVVAVKAFGDDGSADAFTLMNAVTYAVDNSDGPLSLSWGTETPSRFLESAMQYAMDQGTPIFAAVGNEPTGNPVYPAAFPGVIGVAASDGLKLTDYSNYGEFVDLAAPGSAGESQGTSVATAYVAHIYTLYRQRNPEASAVDALTALREAAAEHNGFLTEDAVQRLLVK